MMLTPTACRRMESDKGWVLFFYGRGDVLGYVWDMPGEWWEWGG